MNPNKFIICQIIAAIRDVGPRVSPSGGDWGDPPYYPKNWLAKAPPPPPCPPTVLTQKYTNFVIFMQFLAVLPKLFSQPVDPIWETLGPRTHFESCELRRVTRLNVNISSYIFFKIITNLKQKSKMITLKVAKIIEIVQLEKCRIFLLRQINGI